MPSRPLIYWLQVHSLLIIESIQLGLVQISFLELWADILWPVSVLSLVAVFVMGVVRCLWIHRYCQNQGWDKLTNTPSMTENNLQLFLDGQQAGWRTCCWAPLAWQFECNRVMHILVELQQWVDVTLWIGMAFSAERIQMAEEMGQWLLVLLELEPTLCNQ